MKKSLLYLFVLQALLAPAASAQTVWFTGTYDQAFDTARLEDKIVLVMLASGSG